MTTTTTLDPQREKTLERYTKELLSGVSFTHAYNSHTGADRLNYAHMINNREYGQVIQALGRFAGMGDRYAEIATNAMKRVSPYLNVYQTVAQVAFSLSQEGEWEDTRTLTGPAAPRPSACHHEMDLRTATMMALLLVEVQLAVSGLGRVHGLGWALEEVINREGIQIPRYIFSNIARDLDKRAENKR